ncbi:MAG: right-handed parallel beta-helix repeat-containing protein, partial [Candidatus Marinimicrobia bacterium]|nr:right-handed parallel beta-helix repeat-containing protein [Candidatus Neomarinimicrobiota bacterium]
MKTIKNTFIPILILGSLMAQSRMATVDGYCFLEDSTSHSGVRVLFEAISPSAVTDSAFTSVTGVYSLGLADGIYAVHFSLDGFQPHTLPQNYTFSSSNYSLPDVTLSGGATANVSGYVSGEWFGNTTYMVNGDLTIADGDTLIIYPGTQIKFMGNYTFDIYGSLFAQGVEGDTITFTSGLPVPIAGDWKGIQFFSSSHASVLQYCDIAFGSGTGWEDALVRFYNTSSAPIQILNSKIHTSANHGIYCQSSSPTISGNTIHDNNDNGIYCRSSSPSIRNNLITTLRSNSNAGIYTGEASQPTIENNIIMGYQSGIYAENLQNAIAFNNMWNNSQNYDGFGLPAEIGNYITTNANGDTCDTYNNISMDPLFVDPARYGNYSWELVGDMLTVYLAVQEDMYDETPTVYVGSVVDCDESITMNWTGEYWTAVFDLSSCSPLEDMYIYFDYNIWMGEGELNFVTNPNGPVFDPGNPVGADYNLLVNSPCIDAGNPDAAYYDLDGTVADMGAFPYNHGTITAP